MATWAERFDMYNNERRRERKAEDERNAISRILSSAYENPQAAQSATAYVDDSGEFMGVGTPSGLLESEAVPAKAGGLNMGNAIGALIKGGYGDKALQLAGMMQHGKSGMPSAIQETQWFLNQPEDVQKKHLALKRAAQIMNLGGTMATRDPLSGGIGESYNVTPKPEQMPAFKSEQARQTELGKNRAEKEIERPRVESSIESAGFKAEALDDSINRALGMTGWGTTGLVGNMTKGMPGTKSHDLMNTLDTIKANIGFDKLQEMRNNSKTGGALGQVSEFENRLLQAVWGSLQQSQSEEQFRHNLELVRKQTKESWKRVLAAYEKDYGVPYNGAVPVLDKSSSMSGPKIGDVQGGYVFNGGDPSKPSSWVKQ